MLHLFSGPYVTANGVRLDIPEGSKRLLVFAALQRGHVDRRYAASSLWPIGDDARASGNLRSALWRLKAVDIGLLEVGKTAVGLRKDVLVDVRVLCDWAARVISGRLSPSDLVALPWRPSELDLLPGWYDDWALLERERVRQRLLHGFEALSQLLVERGRCAEAVEVAMAAVSIEPLRETAQQALVEAHLAEGNQVEARRAYGLYRTRLEAELGVSPSARLASLVGACPPRSAGWHRRARVAAGAGQGPGRLAR